MIMCVYIFRYYGLFLWFPEYFKHIQEQELNETSSGNTSIGIYMDSVYTALAAIPATILGILTANILGRKIMLSEYLEFITCALQLAVICRTQSQQWNFAYICKLTTDLQIETWGGGGGGGGKLPPKPMDFPPCKLSP